MNVPNAAAPRGSLDPRLPASPAVYLTGVRRVRNYNER